MSMHHEIARLEDENRDLRNQITAAEIDRACAARDRTIAENERRRMERERRRMEDERIRIENAADCISRTEAAAAERERKNNIREKLVQEAKMVGKVQGLAAFSQLFNKMNGANQIGQSNTNVQSVEAKPEKQQLPSAEVPFELMTPWEKGNVAKNLVKKAFEEVKKTSR